jgi:hypothetical protein
VLTRVGQAAAASPTRQLIAIAPQQVEMLDLPRARPAQKIWLPSTTIVPIVKHNLDRLGLAVDDDADRRLAREGREGRAG